KRLHNGSRYPRAASDLTQLGSRASRRRTLVATNNKRRGDGVWLAANRCTVFTRSAGQTTDSPRSRSSDRTAADRYNWRAFCAGQGTAVSDERYHLRPAVRWRHDPADHGVFTLLDRRRFRRTLRLRDAGAGALGEARSAQPERSAGEDGLID